MKAYVTGATGFVGSHIANELAAQGIDVCTERVDLLDYDGLLRVIKDCEAVFHAAALYSFDASDSELEAVNIKGTQNVIDACISLGVGRLVHTSTAGTCGPVRGREATELDRPPEWELAVGYKRTKLEAERLVFDAVGKGLDAVVVNPTAPIGDGDLKPTPTGRMVERVAKGRYGFGYIANTGLNVVDVRDIARGHLLAYERGMAGERYLLGGENMSLRELFTRIVQVAGGMGMRFRVPYNAARLAAAVGLVNKSEVRLARLPMFFSYQKAVELLNYRVSPIEDALERSVGEALQRKGKGKA